MSDSYDDYEAKIQLAEHAWEKRVDEMVKIEHDKQIEIAQAYERGWNAALAQQEPVAWTTSLDFDDGDQEIIPAKDKGKLGTSNCDIPLYTAPQKAEQEPVQPPEWVGLTNKDIDDCYFAARQPDFDIWAFAAEIEEVLKQKNAWGNHLV